MTDRRSRRNLLTTMKTNRRAGSPMRAYDALPPDLRCWLASACLPWSPASALKIWSRENGARNPAAAISRLNAIEHAMLQKDAGVWNHAARPNG